MTPPRELRLFTLRTCEPALPLALAALAALPGAGTVQAQETGDERFMNVKAWVGHLEVTITASGEIPGADSSSTYSIQRHLDYPFTMDGPGWPIGWFSCDVARGTIEEIYATTNHRAGCVSTVRKTASGLLQAHPPDPNIPPDWPPCGNNHGFQLQIIPIGPESYTSWGFADTIDGQEIQTIGPASPTCTPFEFTSETSFSFFNSESSPVCGGVGCLELPQTGYEILQRWSYDHDEATGVGLVPVHYDVHLTLTGCAEEIDVVVEVIDYESWRPQGGKSEDEEANELVIEARLQGKGGCPTDAKAARFVFELEEVSSEPGVCMNYPPPLGGSLGKPDMAFLRRLNPDPWRPFSPPETTIVTRDGAYRESPRAYLSSFDWGGTAKLKVTAEFDDARQPIVGHLIDAPSLTEIPIPQRKPGSRIADSWLKDQGVEGLPDKDDEEKEPLGDGHRGDGLFLYEEYRGFYEGGDNDHIHGNPKKKDIFVVDTAGVSGGVERFRNATDLEVHGKVQIDQIDTDRVINFNRSPEVGNTTDQHGLLVERRPLGSGLLGLAEGGPGLPAFVRRVFLNTSLTPKSVSDAGGGSTASAATESFVAAHELLHGCNVYHHGEVDLWIDLIVKEVDGKLAYTATTGGSTFVIPLAKEGACGKQELITPPGKDAHLKKLYVAAGGGQHSGVQGCLLRYNIAKHYEGTDSLVIWRHTEAEPPGSLLCGAAGGTGVNAPGHCPQPRYGDAKVGCCKKQICVDDGEGHAPKSAPAAACGAGAGAGGGDEDRAPDVAPPDIASTGSGGAQDAPPLLSLAASERRRTAAYRGWPLLVTFQLVPPGFGSEARAEDFVVTSAAGPWTSAVRLVLKRDGAEMPVWPLVPLGSPPARLALGSDELGAAAWWVTPEATASIAPGDYTLDAVLDTTGSPEGWQGVALSEPVSIAVAAEPAALDPALEAEKALSFARFRAWEGAFAAALSLVDSLLAEQPSNPEALWFRAEILELSGDEAGALEAYEAALEALEAADPSPPEPPALLIRRFEELQERVVLGGGQDEPRFHRGDVNADGQVNISDPVTTLGYLFLGTPGTLPCEKSADADDTGALGLTDAVYVLLFLFSGGPAPAAPFESCGLDATEDGLACAEKGTCG